MLCFGGIWVLGCSGGFRGVLECTPQTICNKGSFIFFEKLMLVFGHFQPYGAIFQGVCINRKVAKGQVYIPSFIKIPWPLMSWDHFKKQRFWMIFVIFWHFQPKKRLSSISIIFTHTNMNNFSQKKTAFDISKCSRLNM